MAARICSLTASKLKLAGFCIGGNSTKLAHSRHDLLDEDEAPELVDKPTILVHRLIWQARALERIETKIHKHRHVGLDGATKPALRLIDEAVLEVIDPDGSQRSLGEVNDLVTLRRLLAR